MPIAEQGVRFDTSKKEHDPARKNGVMYPDAPGTGVPAAAPAGQNLELGFPSSPKRGYV